MSAFAAGLRRSEKENFVGHSDLFENYRRIFNGELVGDVHDPTTHVNFRIEGLYGVWRTEVKFEPDRLTLANSFLGHLRASREKGTRFVFVCVGDPPWENPLERILESFDKYGAWVDTTIDPKIMSSILASFLEAKKCFPESTFPRIPFMVALRRHGISSEILI